MLDLQGLLTVDLLVFFTIGLLGGAHCIGMCGPLVTVYAGRMQKDGKSSQSYLSIYEVRQHTLFNFGRTASYALLGAVFGTIGSALYLAADSLVAIVDLVRGSVGSVVGMLVIGMGLYYVLGHNTAGFHVPGLGLERLFGVLSQRIERLASGPGIIGLGALHGFLPCPILYPAFLYAFASGSPLAGFISLAALGLGTIPAVFLYGTVIESINHMRRRQIHQLLGAAFIVLGYVLLAHGLMSLGVHIPHPSLPHYQPLENVM